jgi:hypothetical protein
VGWVLAAPGYGAALPSAGADPVADSGGEEPPICQVLSGGSYDSNLSFVQALTEAIKLVPNAILLASLPEIRH